MVYEDVLNLIGNTPIIRLNKLGFPNVYVKLEKYNLGGSIKDRAVYGMIKGAEERKALNKGDVLVEATSGNTGIALAMIGKLKGYNVIIVMPETMSIERRQLVKAYGAQLILTEGSKGMNGAVEKANELLNSNQNYKSLEQFDNCDNPKSHYQTTAVEIYEDIPDIDIFTCGIGTGGTLTGVGKYLKEKDSNIKVIGVEPKSSPLISEGKSGAHKIQGIGANFIPKNFDRNICDEILTVKDEDAFEMIRVLGEKEGILVGISSGANIFAAIELSKKFKDKKIVTVAPDGIDKYMSMGIF
ncbi:cysteine synthase A [Romboutsia sp. Marseille-P6047]|uniref:cysteine synthase A n=1 Tax=Romboutsia sp. Marseille-P6047 TaxID=2161817 RepID=UPI000822DB5D|nr:cysteine synthase A [Romboutsia sp. Marseille-P6047]SCH61283.1 Cysteine synthase [uncultured Clostridium sp.]